MYQVNNYHSQPVRAVNYKTSCSGPYDSKISPEHSCEVVMGQCDMLEMFSFNWVI